MPVVTVRTGIAGPDGNEVKLTEYMCDSSGCPNVAAQVVGMVKEIGLSISFCDEHAARLRSRT